MAFIRLTACSGREVVLNTDEISSCHVDGGFSYTDYIVTMRNGDKHYLHRDSYYKVLDLVCD